MHRGPAVVVTGCLILGVFAGAIALARIPQVVSFTPLAPSTMRTSSLSAPVIQPMSNPESGIHPTLVKAVMQQRISTKTPRLNDRRGSSLKQGLWQTHSTPNQPELIVLTEWDINAPPPRLIFAVAEDHRSTYAAVAIANGWLIVQI